MQVSFLELVGLIGVVLVVSTGKVFDPLRSFLRSFTHRYNPSRWLADLISCAMCTGVWVGVIWALVHSWSWDDVVVFSGLLSLLSYFANEVLGLIGILTFRASSQMVASRQVESPRISLQKTRRELRKVAPGDDISEEEADQLLDQETERADLAVVGGKK